MRLPSLHLPSLHLPSLRIPLRRFPVPRGPVSFTAALLIVLAVVGGGYVYRRPDSSAAQRFARFFPYPAVLAGTRIVWANEIFSRQHYVTYYSQKTNQVAAEPSTVRNQIIDYFIELALVEAEATTHNVTVGKNDIDTAFETVAAQNSGREQVKTTLKELYGMSEQEFRGLIADQLILDKFKREVLVTVSVRHILLKDKKKADEIAAQAKGGADFAELAKQFSEDTGSRDAGGSLGFVARGQTTKPFEDVAFNLEPGQISDPVQTEFGWSIIKIEEKKGTIDKSYADWLSSAKGKTRIIKLLTR